jgi:hypothetical protein
VHPVAESQLPVRGKGCDQSGTPVRLGTVEYSVVAALAVTAAPDASARAAVAIVVLIVRFMAKARRSGSIGAWAPESGLVLKKHFLTVVSA